FLKERLIQRTLMKEELEYELHHCKVFAQAFFKKLAVSKGRALVALRRERNLLNGVFFLQSFFFCALCVKRKSVIGGEFCW
ncbi:MAG: hypothetical protein IKA68_04415, partial [Clostridia bacterium]|nr:hypothetical protein [Clostridia bacterium]MBR2613925.1 hypothetical protein [Clostridia bacterium]